MFGNKLIDEKVFIFWFSGDLNFPLTKKILRWDGLFSTTFEKEKVLAITNGKVIKTEDVENYIDDPKRINRKYDTRISDILFKKLKKVKWKNSNEFDCSGKYLITIDEGGDVSKVRLLKESGIIDDNTDDDEYRFCLTNMRKAIATLKFDIIKQRGKPVSEDIYMEIWMEDNGKIKDWTHN